MILKDKWIEVIRDFHERKLPEVIEREIEIPLNPLVQRAISIIGPRRAGKTYEMFGIITKLLEKGIKKEQILYVNLERAELEGLNSEDLSKMSETFFEIYPENKNKKVWFFLDEIQNVSNWEKFVRTILDENIRVYLSGSSSKMLSTEIATSMRGRSISYTILPFSFREYLRAKKIEFSKFLSSQERAGVINALRNYMNYGGYPEAILYELERDKILTDIRETAIYRDVIERAKIRNVKVMRLLINALINSKEFSTNKFYHFLKSGGIKVGKNILYSYIQYLNDAFFVFMLRKFSYSYKNSEQSIPKVYFVDNGLLNISGISDKGRLMENLVFIELYRKGLDTYYFKSITNEEVDFVVLDKKKVKQLIQVCYSFDNFMTKEREVKALIKASNELRCNNLAVITFDYEGKEKFKGKEIKFIPLWKWLVSGFE